MEKRFIDRFAHLMGRYVPDAITASVAMLLLLSGASLALGDSVVKAMEAYYRGLWMLLPFTMQMTLIIVLSSVLGTTSFFRKAIIRVSRVPATANQVIVMAVLATAGASYLYWGLGLVLSPIIAVHFATQAERKGIAIDFPFFLAVVFAAHAVWQFGLSASAPLLVATPGHFLEGTIGLIPLSQTIWSPAAIIHELVFTTAVIAVGCLLMRKDGIPVSSFPASVKLLEEAQPEPALDLNVSERVERHFVGSLLLCAMLVGWLYFHFVIRRLSLDLNSLNTILLLLCLALHRNIHAFTNALQKAVVSAWPVIVVYHFYAGVAGVVQFTSVGERLAGLMAGVSSPHTFTLLTATLGAVFAIFIPSSGGQWAVQGLVTVKAAMAVGVSVPHGILALSIGDHMGNFLSPFWVALVAGIARIDFRTFFGYGLLFSALWFVIGVLVFTFVR